jgi:voltage-gated potassium channel
MAVLGLAWLALFIIDVVRGLDPLLTALSTAIWLLFIADFAIRLLLAPDRWGYLRRSWLTVVSLVIPALRVARVASAVRAFRVARAARGVRLVRAVASLNRGLGALGATMRRHGVWYVAAFVVTVCLAGAGGMYALEPHEANGRGFSSYADALWWTAMIMTTMGSAYWPRTAEGRILAVLISLAAIGVFGYLTATLASFLVGQDSAVSDGKIAAGSEVRALRREIAELRRELREKMAIHS